MQRFTERRDDSTRDEIWFLEHPPVFTLGMAGKREHVLAPGDIPVVQIERGGQVTYHGPGQLVVYPLIDLRRANLGVRDFVTALERAVIDYVARVRHRRADAAAMRPACMCESGKLASVGIRVRRGASYHGIALNVNLDLEPSAASIPAATQGCDDTALPISAAPSPSRLPPAVSSRICSTAAEALTRKPARFVTAPVTGPRLTPLPAAP